MPSYSDSVTSHAVLFLLVHCSHICLYCLSTLCCLVRCVINKSGRFVSSFLLLLAHLISPTFIWTVENHPYLLYSSHCFFHLSFKRFFYVLTLSICVLLKLCTAVFTCTAVVLITFNLKAVVPGYLFRVGLLFFISFKSMDEDYFVYLRF